MIEFFKKLFGMASDAADDIAKSTNNDTVAPPRTNEEAVARSVKGLEHIEGAEHIRVSHGKTIREVKGAALIEDEDDGDLLWHDTWNKEIPPERWVDEWGPVDAKDFDTFWHHKTEFDMAHSGDPDEAEAKVLARGYRDMGHFFQVGTTFLKHFGTRDPGANLDDSIYDQERVSQAAIAGARRFQEDQHAAAVASNPELLAPVEGVDLDTYAKLAATSASGADPADFTKMLGEHGMDMAKWTRVNGEWTDRMSKDTSGAIGMAYSKAFGAAGAGQFGAAGAAGMDALGQRSVTAAGGAEPMPFEKYCEIQGAMTAWSNTGQDVNAMLKHTFGMTAVDWSTASMWWMSKMQSELSLFDKHSTLTEKYEKQYSAGAPAGADDDLSF